MHNIFFALFLFHLSRKCRKSVAGGRCDVSTCHRNAGKVWQVGGMMMPPVTEIQGKCARWAMRCFHLSQKCCESVPGGRYDDATCHRNAVKVWQVDGAMLLPVTEMWEKCGRWTVRCCYLSRKRCESTTGGRCAASTCHGNAAKVCQVWCFHLSRKCCKSVAGGRCNVAPVTEMLGKYDRWTLCCFYLSRKCCESMPSGRYGASTCHGNAGKVCQVDGMMLPPLTEMRRKCARWAV